MLRLSLRSGKKVAPLGMGTWKFGENRDLRTTEIATLRAGIASGLNVVDTAEMYGDGRAEEIVAEGISGHREHVLLISKVLPHHASIKKIHASCEASLRRLKTDQIDLYLLHWRGPVPLKETIEGFEALKRRGLIAQWGVSNFDVDDLNDLRRFSENAVCNEILYNLSERGVEFSLLDAHRRASLSTIAYSPLNQGRELFSAPALVDVAQRHVTAIGPATPLQIALAWTVRIPGIIAIPKTSLPFHLRQNMAAASITLTKEDLAILDEAFPPPRQKQPLAMI